MKDRFWMQFGRVQYWIGSDTLPSDVTIRDVARALSKINRFTGHSTRPYSVAQHSVFVSQLCDIDTETALYALMHDAHEAVVGDMNWPLKQYLKAHASSAYEALKEVEDAAAKAMHSLVGLPYPAPPEIAAMVKKADWIAVETERRQLMPDCSAEWSMTPYPAHHTRLEEMDCYDASDAFSRRAANLMTALKAWDVA